MKGVNVLILALIVCLSPVLHAQEANFRSDSQPDTTDKPVYESKVTYNVLRFTPGKLMLGGIALSYERAMASKFSVSVGAQYIQPQDFSQSLLSNHLLGKILLDKGIISESFSLNTTNVSLDSGTFKGITVTPEFRFYPGFVGSPYGFYVSAFGRYMQYDGDVMLNYQQGNTSQSMALSMSANGIGGGLGIGIQKIFFGRLAIDWNAGVGMVPATFEISGENPQNLPLQEYLDEFNQHLADFPFYKPISFTQQSPENNRLDAVAKNPFVILRSNLSIGIAF